MKNNVVIAMPSTDASVTTNGTTLPSGQWASVSFHAVISGSDVAGSLKLQVSNDAPTNGLQSPFEPTNWIDLPNQSADITSSSDAILTVANMSYQFIRAVWTATSGTGNIAVNCSMLSV